MDRLIMETKKIANPFIITDEECELVQLDKRGTMGYWVILSNPSIKLRDLVKNRLINS